MKRQEINVYRPNARRELGFLRTWAVMVRNIVRSRDLIWQLFKRDFIAGYKKSFVGLAWMFVSPVLGIVSWVFLYRTGMLNPGDPGVPYPVFVLIGSSVWGFFMGCFGSASQTLSSGSGLILQVRYPHEALLFKETAQYLATFIVTFVVNLVLLALFRVVPCWTIVFFPLALVPVLLLGTGLGLVVSLISVVAYDVNRMIQLLLGFAMYLTPVIYTPGQVAQGVIGRILVWNPFTYLVCTPRDLILYGSVQHPLAYSVSVALAVFTFMVSWRLFYVCEDKLVERMV
jgi:lipopolysaccharide transport system permease protein